MSSNGMYMRVVGQKVKDATDVKIPGGGDGEFFEIMNWSMSMSRTVSMNTDTKNQDQGTIHFDPINISMLKSGASPLLYSMMLKFDKTYQLEIVETKPASKGDGVEISHKVTLDEARTIGRSISSIPDSVAHENFTFSYNETEEDFYIEGDDSTGTSIGKVGYDRKVNKPTSLAL